LMLLVRIQATLSLLGASCAGRPTPSAQLDMCSA
jgi:hypothetical protein